MWMLLFIVLATGQTAEYGERFKTLPECIQAMDKVTTQIKEANPGLDKEWQLVCRPVK